MSAPLHEQLDWDKQAGLMPAVVQDADTLQVLMLGYMNAEALKQTLASQQVTFYSRSKQRLWTKGETSGNTLQLIDIMPDCDNDTLLVRAKPTGPSCHLNNTSCFGTLDAPGVGFLSKLAGTIAQRHETRPEKSYTTTLFEAGVKRIAQKVGEEGVEVALAAMTDSREELTAEAADLLYHLLVLLKAKDIPLSDVMSLLQSR